MIKQKIVYVYSNGKRDEQDEVYDSDWQAEEYTHYLVSCHQSGGETLVSSNPYNFDIADDKLDLKLQNFTIIELEIN